MKEKLMISMVLFALLGMPALAEDPAQDAQPQAAMEQTAPGERTKDLSRGERPQGMGDGGFGGGWGGVVWATKEEQAKHPCFVLVPVFTETIVNDNFETSDQIDTAVRLIKSLAKTYSLDTDRLYATSQSMGGMTSFHLNVKYPELFAASLFVGSQWDNEMLHVLEDGRFFYIVSAGDDKASAGQSGLMEVFDRDGAAYAHAEWSAQDAAQVQEAAVQAMLAQGCGANFVTFTKGTTVQGGADGSEHLTSFDYAYRLEAVRDWLFAQSK